MGKKLTSQIFPRGKKLTGEKTDRYTGINQEIRRLMRKKDKLYRRWSRSGRPHDQKKFLDQKHLVRRIIDRAYEKYLKDILGLNNEEHDLEAPPKAKIKKLNSLLKHSKQDPSGISVLKFLPLA